MDTGARPDLALYGKNHQSHQVTHEINSVRDKVGSWILYLIPVSNNGIAASPWSRRELQLLKREGQIYQFDLAFKEHSVASAPLPQQCRGDAKLCFSSTVDDPSRRDSWVVLQTASLLSTWFSYLRGPAVHDVKRSIDEGPFAELAPF